VCRNLFICGARDISGVDAHAAGEDGRRGRITMTQGNFGRRAVNNQRSVLFVLASVMATAMMALLAGCGGSTANVQNPPPPPPNNVSITFSPEPGGSLAVGFSENLIAVVTNDPGNGGASWTLTCQIDPGNKQGLCGALTVNGVQANHTASGSPITYTAPLSISASSMAVEIVALATDEPTENVVAPITVTTFDSGFTAGYYVLQAQGVENSSPYQFAGVIELDGAGDVLGGEQTVNSNGVSVTDPISQAGSSYFLGSDGRGFITLNTGDDTIGGNGIETFAFVYLSSSQALISQVDILAAQTGASATGTMDLQNSSAAATVPTGSYAFVLSGYDVLDINLNTPPLVFGGVLDIPSGTTISGVIDEFIANTEKLTGAPISTGSTILSGPDAFGQITFTLTGIVDASHPKPVSIVVTGYIVDSTHIKLIESDAASNSGVTPFGTTGGLAIAQAAGSYGTFANSSLSGNFVYGITGVDLSTGNIPPSGIYVPTTLTTAAVFNADGAGGLDTNNANQGFMDVFLQLSCVQIACTKGIDGVTITGSQISSSFTGSYSVDSSGTGRTTLNGFSFVSDAPSPTYSPTIFFYLTGNASGPAALIMAAGDLTNNPKLHYPSIGTGIAYPQSSATPGISGPYGLSFTQVGSSGENDGTGQMTANATSQTLSGFADSSINAGLPSLPDQSFGGTFNSPADLPFSGVLENVNQSSAFTVGNNGSQFPVDYYFIDPEHGFFVETDLVSPSPGSAQVSFGYYAGRTPLCQGCP